MMERLRQGHCVGTLPVEMALPLVAAVFVLITSAPAAGAGLAAHRAATGACCASSSGQAAVVEVVQTDPGLSQRLTRQRGLSLSTVRPDGVPVIDVNERVRYQQFAGIGASMTDSSAWLIHDQLRPRARHALMEDLFGSAGIHLRFLRVPMGASDFTLSAHPYSYDDIPPRQSDPSLSRFSIAHDMAYILPTLRQALAINHRLELLANPWSPPAWMKANRSLDNRGGHGSLLTSAYVTLAIYFLKFIKAYASQGVPIDAITPQNEPSSGGGGTTYPGLTLPEADEADFIARDLQPVLRAAGLRTRIYGNDLSWASSAYADGLASGPAAGDLAGISWHCYFGSPTAMARLHRRSPRLDQIVDECSPEIRAFGAPEFLISSLRNWASAVAVWNVALNPQGGPVQALNGCIGCRGVVTIDEQSHAVSFGPEYYQLGQVGAFVQPGASRIDSQNLVSYGVNSSNIETITAGLDDVAFLNPDGSKVMVAYNNSTAPISFAVASDGSYFTYSIPAQAMTTFVWRTARPIVTLHGSPSGTSGVARFRLSCAADPGGCHIAGSLTTTETIQGTTPLALSAGSKRRHRLLVVGSRRLTIAAGKTITMTIMLNATGRNLLTTFKSLPVKLTIALTADGQRRTVTIRKLIVTASGTHPRLRGRD